MERLRKIDIKKATSIAGTILMIASLFFIGIRLADMWDYLNFYILASAGTIMLLLLVVFGESFNVLLIAENFRFLVRDLSQLAINRPLAMKIYNSANMYKYIPGGFMYIVGRSQLAVEVDELSHGKVALSTAIEGVLWAVAALILASIYTFDYLVLYVGQRDLHFLWLMLGLLAPVVVLVAYRFRHKIKEITKGLRAMMVIKRLMTMLVIVNFWGMSFLATMAILGQPITLSLGFTIVGLFIVSWLVGYLTPGAPSGLGIREIVLMMFLSGIVYEDILLSAIVIHRALQIFGDLVAYGIAWSYARIKLKA